MKNRNTNAGSTASTGRRERSWLRWGIGLVVIAAVVMVARARMFPAEASSGESLKDPVALESRALNAHLLETGVVELRTTIEVKSKLSGKVLKLLVEQGDAVEKDQVLAIIEPDPNEVLRLYQKRAAVESRRIALQEARRDLDRAVTLHEKGVMPGDQFERVRDQRQDADTAYRLALLELQALEREINPAVEDEIPPASTNAGPAALNTFTDVRVLSPLRGIVIERPVEVGELVLSGTVTTLAGTTIMKLGDPAEAVLRAAINEVDIGKVKVGQRVEVTLIAHEDRVFSGRIAKISPIGIREKERNIVTFSVEVELARLDPRIMPGMTCDLDIIIESKADAACLPHRALFQELEEGDEDNYFRKEEEERAEKEREGGGDGEGGKGGSFFEAFGAQDLGDEVRRYLDYVWVQDGNDWVKRAVEIGIKGEKHTEILGGVTAEDAIYPDAEHMRWIVAERERREQKRFRWPWQKKEEE